MRYLDLLDYKAIRKYRKAFVGYSDCTALHMAINRYSHLITYHGPMGVDFKLDRKSDIDTLFNALEGKLKVIEPLLRASPEVQLAQNSVRVFFTRW